LDRLHGFIHQMLVGHRLAAAHTGVGRDHDLGLGVVDAHRQVVGREPAEHHRVNRTDPGAGQHGDGGFGDHRHVNDDPVALTHAQRLQYRREAVHFAVQFGVGVNLGFVGFRRDVDQRPLVGAVGQMPVHGVVAKIGLAADKPLAKRRLAVVAQFSAAACANGFSWPVRPRNPRGRRWTSDGILRNSLS
jgi:hypothetical protein